MNELYLKERRRAERISFAFPARTSTGIIGETVNFSRTGIRLALERPLLSIRTVPIKIHFPFSEPLESYVEIVWNRSQIENNRFLCGARFLRLQDNEQNKLKDAINSLSSLDYKFVFLTEKMRDWLADFKIKCEKFDSMYHDDSDRVKFVEKNQPDMEATLDAHFNNTWECIKGIKVEDYDLHMRYYWDMLGSYVIDASEVGRFFHGKPLGYTGDFMIMNYFYDYINKYLGETSYEKLIQHYACNIPISYSVVERKNFLKQKISDILSEKSSPRILSVASGAARELIELVEEGKINKPLYFDCLDVEPEAFECIKNKLETIDPENKHNLRIRFIREDFLNIIRGRNGDNLFDKYDLIYSAGLLDYLSDRMARKLLSYLFNLLKDNSSLIATNVKASATHRSYYEMLGGWKLIYRTDREILDWADEIKEKCFAELIDLKTEKPFMFAILALHKRSVNL
jgi:hypothetical protein